MKKNYQENLRIEQLLKSFLQRGENEVLNSNAQTHFDEDSLTALFEDKLLEREKLLYLKHLTECRLCRWLTISYAETIDVSRANLPRTANNEKTKLSFESFLNNLKRLFTPTSQIVNAYKKNEEFLDEDSDD